LQKIIRCVSVATGTDISLNPLKVVAGLEPEETNRFLQILGKAAIKKVFFIQIRSTQPMPLKSLRMDQKSHYLMSVKLAQTWK
jgi:hypothetical protein